MKRRPDLHNSNSNKAIKTTENEEINHNNLSGPQAELEKLKIENEKMKSQLADSTVLVGSLYTKKQKYKQKTKAYESVIQSIRQELAKVSDQVNASSPPSSANLPQGFHTSQASVNNNNNNQPSPPSSPKNNCA